MIFFLYGPDTYRSHQKLNKIVSSYRNKNKKQLDLITLDFRENPIDYPDFKSEFNSVSIFSEMKMFILKNVFLDSQFKKSFLNEAKTFLLSKNMVMFYEDNHLKVTDPLLKFLLKSAKCQKFNLLPKSSLGKWLSKESQKYNLEFTSSAESLLLYFTGNNLWRLSQEIKKLAAFKKGKTITDKDISDLVRPQIQSDIFKTIDSIALKNKAKALFLIHNHLKKGDNPFYLLSMISFQFRNLVIVKDLSEKGNSYYNISRLLKSNPYFLRKIYSQSEKFDFLTLKKIYQTIFEVDFDIKTGKIDPELGLDLLISKII